MKFIKFIFRILNRFFKSLQSNLIQFLFGVIKLFKIIFFRLINPNVYFYSKNQFGTYHTDNGLDLYLTSLLFNNLISNNQNIIVDVGIAGPCYLSKTFIFESHFNCKVVNIGLVNQYKDVWESIRPSALFINCSIDTSQKNHSIIIDYNNPNLNELNFFSSNYKPNDSLTSIVQTKSLENVLSDLGFKEVLVLFLDFNFYDLNTIYNIELENLNIKCICLNLGKSSLFKQHKIQLYLKNIGFYHNARIGDECDIFIRYSLLHGIEISDLM